MSYIYLLYYALDEVCIDTALSWQESLKTFWRSKNALTDEEIIVIVTIVTPTTVKPFYLSNF